MPDVHVDKMTTAEWELMRIIWTLGKVGSREVIEIIQRKRDWTESTIKTLLSRLVKKEMLTTTKDGRNFIYHATVPEQTAMNETVDDLFDSLCNMKKGAVITELISNLTLTKADIENMQTVLADKLTTAPEMVECDCIPVEGTSCNQCTK